MNVVGRVGSLISQGVTTVASPFHPFGGAVDIIVVQREDGTYRSTPWCVRFGKFQGVLKVSEKIVTISVNGADANFHMYLDNSGEAYFLKEVDTGEDGSHQGEDLVQNVDKGSLGSSIFYAADDACEEESQMISGSEKEFQIARLELGNDESMLSVESFVDGQSFEENNDELLSTSSSFHYESIGGMQPDDDGSRMSHSSESEVVLMTVDGHLIMAPVSASENVDNVQLSTPQFYLVSDEDSGMGIDEVQGSTEYKGVYTENCAQKAPGVLAFEQHEQSSCSVQEFGASSADNLPESIIVNKDRISSSASEACVGTKELISQVEETSSSGNVADMCFEKVQADPDESVTQLALDSDKGREGVFKSCPTLSKPAKHFENGDSRDMSNLHVSPKVIQNAIVDGEGSYGHVNDLIIEEAAEVRLGQEASTSNVRETEKASATEVGAGTDSCKTSTNSTDGAAEKQKAIQSVLLEAVDNGSRDGATGDMDTSESHWKIPPELAKYELSRGVEISLCGSLLHTRMGVAAAAEAFEAHQISEEEFKVSGASIIKNKNLVVRCEEKYLPWDKAATIILGMAVFGLEFPSDPSDAIPVEQDEISRLNSQGVSSLPSRGWRFWPIPFRQVKTLERTNSNSLNDEVSVSSEPLSESLSVKTVAPSDNKNEPPRKQLMRTNIPTNEQIASLNLKDGQNVIAFSFCTRVLGKQQVDARIYLWKSNARIVISDVDGTITKSDVLGQFMPLVGRDWTQSGVARLFSAIKENGYQLLFLSARAIAQAYLTRNFLHNLKQDGKALPNGPVLISPDGLSYSFIREVVRRKPHEFKIACLEVIFMLQKSFSLKSPVESMERSYLLFSCLLWLWYLLSNRSFTTEASDNGKFASPHAPLSLPNLKQEIRALFPSDYNPFYAGFGNRDTDELSYRKIGIPKGKIFIINPKGEVAINNCVDSRSYCSLHTLVNDMFPPTSLREQEDFNNWNYWKLPFMSIEN